MVTVTEVAREAGVAYSTASLALRGVGKVAPATRERVLAAARRLGYEANAAASILASQRKDCGHTRSLSVAYLGGPQTALARGVEEMAVALGYGFEEIVCDDKTDMRRLGKALWHRGVCGVVLHPGSRAGSERWRELELHRFAAVKIHRVLPEVPVSLIRTSAPQIIMMALDAIYSRNYRSVLAIMTRSASSIDDDLREGALYTYRKRHLPDGGRLSWWDVASVDELARDGASRLRTLIAETRPDALLIFPWPILNEILKAGYSIPNDFGVAAAVVAESPELVTDAIAGVFTSEHLHGKLAVKYLHQLVLSGQRGIPATYEEILFGPVWRDGKSLPPR